MPEMQMVVSSNIEAIGYAAECQQLHVRFSKSGTTYVYHGVEEWVYSEFMAAESKGQYLNANIKNVYQHSQL
ncbi:MAG: KTSC domain-containing protein [Planctomycetota bacterium]|nr:MAG: KTSC domain-containing protein [Planctomycetota bacterium]